MTTFSGTKQQLGPFTYYSFRSSGTAQELGTTTYCDFTKIEPFDADVILDDLDLGGAMAEIDALVEELYGEED